MIRLQNQNSTTFMVVARSLTDGIRRATDDVGWKKSLLSRAMEMWAKDQLHRFDRVVLA